MTQTHFEIMRDEEIMVRDMEKQEIIARISLAVEEIEELLYRHKHYAQPLGAIVLETIQSELKFILRRHS